MTALLLHRRSAFVAALLIAAGIILLQMLIGGRRLLFVLPGVALISAAALLGLASISRSKAKPDPLCLSTTGIFCTYVLVRAFLTPGYYAWADLFSVAGALIVYGLTVTVVTSSSARSALFAVLLAFALVHVVIGAVQFSRGDNFMLIRELQRTDYGQRASGFFVCPNHLAGLLEVLGIVGLSLTCWGRWPIWSKILIGYATGICFVGIALTGSRGGYLSAFTSLGIFGILSLIALRTARPRVWLQLGAVGLVTTILLVATAGVLIQRDGFLKERAGNIIDTKNMRLNLWRAAVQQWKLEPLVGTGAGSYRFYGRQFRTEDMQDDPIDVHNDYLHLLCEYGAVGVAGFLLFFSSHVRHGWRGLRRLTWRCAEGGTILSNRLALNMGALAAVGAYVVHSAVDFNLHIPANAVLLAFVFGMLANPGISSRSHQPEDAGAVRGWPTLMLRAGAAILGLVGTIQCARLFPGEYYTERARVALRDEDPQASMVLAHTALNHGAQSPEVFFYIGRASVARAHQTEQPGERARLYESAIQAFKKAHELAPLDGDYLLDLAYTYDSIGRFAEAEEMFTLARSRDPNSDAVAQLYRAHIELSKRHPTARTQSM